MPEPPSFLNEYARQEWDRLALTLHSIGTLAEVDQAVFAAYCQAYARWRQAEEDLERMAQVDPSTHAVVLRTKEGNLFLNPLLGAANTLRRDMQRLAAEFGLTPSARTQIQTADPYANDVVARKYGLY
jgi:P27 family predicted phage terminase small subunit